MIILLYQIPIKLKKCNKCLIHKRGFLERNQPIIVRENQKLNNPNIILFAKNHKIG